MTLAGLVPFDASRLWSLRAIFAVNDLAALIGAPNGRKGRTSKRRSWAACAPVPMLTAPRTAQAMMARNTRSKEDPPSVRRLPRRPASFQIDHVFANGLGDEWTVL